MASRGSWSRGGAAIASFACGALVASVGAAARAQDRLWTAIGDKYGDELGFGVATIGDVDFDGVDDVFASESRYGPLARVFSGKRGTKLYDLVGIGEVTPKRLGDVNGDGRADYVIEGFSSGVRSGKNGSLLYYVTAGFLVAVGDVSGDGIVDLAGFATAGFPLLGEVRVFSGADGHKLRTIAPAGRGPDFGWGLAPVGDRDGDGVTDLAVTVDGTIQTTIGRIAIYSLASGALLASSMNVAGYSNLGPSIEAAGDLDGDGFVDLVCSSPFAAPGGLSYAGEVNVLSTGAMTVLATFPGTAAFDFFHSEGVVGDIDGDGCDDFVLASNPSTMHWCCSGRTFRRLYALQYVWGTSGVVARGSDLDGDGLVEFLDAECHNGNAGFVAVERGRRAFLTVDPKYRRAQWPSGGPPAAGELEPWSVHFFGADLQPGALVTLLLTEADGASTSVVVATAPADSFGEWRHAIVVPPDGLHHDLGFVLVGHDRNGHAVATAPERVALD
jgi:hypothetical protein